MAVMKRDWAVKVGVATNLESKTTEKGEVVTVGVENVEIAVEIEMVGYLKLVIEGRGSAAAGPSRGSSMDTVHCLLV